MNSRPVNAAPSEPFVPLIPAASAVPTATADTRLKVLWQPASTQPFKPLVPAGACPPAAAVRAAAGPPPTVTVQRNGDLVTQIRVQCGCGQVIELDCHY